MSCLQHHTLINIQAKLKKLPSPTVKSFDNRHLKCTDLRYPGEALVSAGDHPFILQACGASASALKHGSWRSVQP